MTAPPRSALMLSALAASLAGAVPGERRHRPKPKTKRGQSKAQRTKKARQRMAKESRRRNRP